MPKLIDIKPLPNYRLWLRYEDGTEGEVDLSDLAGRGVFAAWQEPGAFDRVSIGTGGEVVWASGADLCPDMLYTRLTGKQSPMKYTAILYEAEEGGFWATCAEVPEASGQGETAEEAIEDLKAAIELVLQYKRERGQRPEPARLIGIEVA